jgi:hypothetical protein
MFEKFWLLLSLHNRKSRIIFIAAMVLILTLTSLGAFYWYAP